MKILLKYSGIVLIIAAVVLIGLYIFFNMVSNTVLVVSGALLIFGLLGYIYTNKIFV